MMEPAMGASEHLQRWATQLATDAGLGNVSRGIRMFPLALCVFT